MHDLWGRPRLCHRQHWLIVSPPQQSTGLINVVARRTKCRGRRAFQAFAVKVQVLQLETVCTAGVFAAFAFSSRPHGRCQSSLVQVRESGIHDRGVFARCEIPEGTVLGCYPGFARQAADMARKVAQHPDAQQYVFNTQNGWFLDPTNAKGKPREGKLWGLVDTTLAFVNEPPPGMTTNVEIRDGRTPLDVLFIASRCISAKEELLVDYGSLYDRSSYGI